MKEIVWVYGVSAAGKETFIRKIIHEQPPLLLEQFGWQNKKIAASQASLKYIGSHDNDEIVEKRQEIEQEVPELIKENDVILIKGQYVDFEANRQTKLRKILPSCKHKVIDIRVQDTDMPERLISKHWWLKDHNPHKWASDERAMLEELLKELGKNFEIIAINGNKNSNYEIL